MRNGLRSGGRRAPLVRDDDIPANEDFLFHLSRGSELLMQNRVVEAKEELERALSFQPRDAQSQDLLAGVYFRLGVYPTAIELWRQILRDFPDDPILHVNLGLCFLKTGQPEEARDHLLQAIDLDPDHERAYGYLGLVLWRLGKLDAARDAFLRGGQLTMAKRMEEALAESEPPPPAVTDSQDAETAVEDSDVTAMRDAAGEAEARLFRNEVALSLELERPQKNQGQWRVVETGADPMPRVRRASRSLPAFSPPPLGAVAESWAVELPEDTPLAIGTEGELLIQTKGAVHARIGGLRAVRGEMKREPVYRRYRGRAPSEPMGDADDPIVRWAGPTGAILAAPAGARFHALRVSGAHLYVREELVQAFDDRVSYESGKLPLAGEPVVLLSFHGEGTVVLRLPRRPSGLEVTADQEVRVDPASLVGWTGRLFPTQIQDPDPASVPLAFKGQGILLVT
jgi:Flp pilus assembly protein TadD